MRVYVCVMCVCVRESLRVSECLNACVCVCYVREREFASVRVFKCVCMCVLCVCVRESLRVSECLNACVCVCYVCV